MTNRERHATDRGETEDSEGVQMSEWDILTRRALRRVAPTGYRSMLRAVCGSIVCDSIVCDSIVCDSIVCDSVVQVSVVCAGRKRASCSQHREPGRSP